MPFYIFIISEQPKAGKNKTKRSHQKQRFLLVNSQKLNMLKQQVVGSLDFLIDNHNGLKCGHRLFHFIFLLSGPFRPPGKLLALGTSGSKIKEHRGLASVRCFDICEISGRAIFICGTKSTNHIISIADTWMSDISSKTLRFLQKPLEPESVNFSCGRRGKMTSRAL